MTRRAVVAAVIREGSRVLVAQRSDDRHYPSQWEFPGGKVEPGETPEAALRRELREELDVDVEVGKLLEEIHHDYGGGHDYELAFYACRILRGTPSVQPGQGLQRVVWVEAKTLASLDFLAGNRVMVARLSRQA